MAQSREQCGLRVGNWVLGDTLGSGGFGEVFSARWKPQDADSSGATFSGERLAEGAESAVKLEKVRKSIVLKANQIVINRHGRSTLDGKTAIVHEHDSKGRGHPEWKAEGTVRRGGRDDDNEDADADAEDSSDSHAIRLAHSSVIRLLDELGYGHDQYIYGRIEPNNIRRNALVYEALVYEYLRDNPHLPRLLDTGLAQTAGKRPAEGDRSKRPHTTGGFDSNSEGPMDCDSKSDSYGEVFFIAMERLGPTLRDIKTISPEGRLPVRAVIHIMPMLIECLESIHKRGVIYRDVKPDQFCVGRYGDIEKIVMSPELYLIDFGLARFHPDLHSRCVTAYSSRRAYLDSLPDDTNRIRASILFDRFSNHPGKAPSGGMNRTGTAKYSSLSVHANFEHSFMDDFESLMYLVLDLCLGGLPWGNISRTSVAASWQYVRKVKKGLDIAKICKDLPVEFIHLLVYSRMMDRGTLPDYTGIKARFENLREKSLADSKRSDKLCWAIPSEEADGWVENERSTPRFKRATNSSREYADRGQIEMDDQRDLADIKFSSSILFFEKYRVINGKIVYTIPDFREERLSFEEDDYLTESVNDPLIQLLRSPDSASLSRIKSMVQDRASFETLTSDADMGTATWNSSSEHTSRASKASKNDDDNWGSGPPKERAWDDGLEFDSSGSSKVDTAEVWGSTPVSTHQTAARKDWGTETPAWKWPAKPGPRGTSSVKGVQWGVQMPAVKTPRTSSGDTEHTASRGGRSGPWRGSRRGRRGS